MTGPLTPDVLIYDLTPASDPQISPDGARIAYTLGQTRRPQDGKPARATRQVWLCDRDGGAARQLTQTGDRNNGARWSPDGQWLAFVSNRPAATAKPGEPGQGYALCVLAVDGPGEARELTRHAHQIRELAWSPDGRHLA
ncbi:MAG: TolB family protein, partial [Thermomicrobiales bacterium]